MKQRKRMPRENGFSQKETRKLVAVVGPEELGLGLK